MEVYQIKLISVALRSKAKDCCRFIAGIAGSNLADGIDVCPFCMLCVVQVAGCAMGWSLFQRSVSVCNLCDL